VNLSNLNFLCTGKSLIQSQALDISADGQVIVGWLSVHPNCLPKRAFMWSASTNTAQLLRNVVTGLGSYAEESANGVSATGLNIVGHSEPGPHAWRVDLSQNPSPLADIDGDGRVTASDLLAAVQAWGECGSSDGGCLGDANSDGVVDARDVLMMLNNLRPDVSD
jgi:hypothetical protein